MVEGEISFDPIKEVVSKLEEGMDKRSAQFFQKGCTRRNLNVIVKPPPHFDSSTPLDVITIPSIDSYKIDLEIHVPSSID